MSKVTKWQKDKLQELADKQMLLPSIDYFVGRERGMHKMLTCAKPQIEKLLLTQRKQAVDTINNATSDIQQQYDKALKESRNKIAVETTKSFLNALKFQPNSDINKVRGLKNGILVRDKDTGQPLHVLPNQYLLYRGDAKCYFPKNDLSEGSATAEIGRSFSRAYRHKNARLNKV